MLKMTRVSRSMAVEQLKYVKFHALSLFNLQRQVSPPRRGRRQALQQPISTDVRCKTGPLSFSLLPLSSTLRLRDNKAQCSFIQFILPSFQWAYKKQKFNRPTDPPYMWSLRLTNLRALAIVQAWTTQTENNKQYIIYYLQGLS